MIFSHFITKRNFCQYVHSIKLLPQKHDAKSYKNNVFGTMH